MFRTTTLWKILVVGLLTVLAASQVGTALAGTTVWTSNGPEAGTIHVVVIDPLNLATLYVATFGGGVFKSTDGGGSWGAANTGLTDTDVVALAVDPATPGTLYVGTRESGAFKSQRPLGSKGAQDTLFGGL